MLLRHLLLICFLPLPFTTSSAIVIADHSSGNTAPAPPSPHILSNTGAVLNGAAPSATYLSDGWFITAEHNFGLQNDVFINQSTHTWDQSINEGLGYFPLHRGEFEVDVRLFRVMENVNLPDNELNSIPVSEGEAVAIAGTGAIGIHVANSSVTDLDDYFTWAGSRATPIAGTHWGTNIVDNIIETDPEKLFSIKFDAPSSNDSTPYEAQGTAGDSGSGAYVERGGEWRLTGMAIRVQSFPGVSRFGDLTYFIDLADHRDEIHSIIYSPVPEPSSAFLALLTFSVFLQTRRRS